MEDTAVETKATVVVVNDDSHHLHLLGKLLRGDGKDVLLFGSVAEAIGGFARMSSLPDLIVTDLYMPDIDGWRFCRLLRGPEFAAQARSLLAERSPNIAAIDYHLPDGTCTDLLGDIREKAPNAATIVMTGDPDPHLAVDVLRAGASAYVHKPFHPTYIVELSERAQRERSLLRVEAILDERTRELRESESRYRELVKGIPDAILVHDGGGTILDCNDVLLDWIQATRNDTVGLNVRSIMTTENAHGVDHRICEGMESGRQIFESCLRCADGKQIPTEVCDRVLPWGGRNAILSVHRDLRERRRSEKRRAALEDHLRQQQKLEALGILAGGVAHEINNPINGIMNYAQLIRERGSNPAEVSMFAGEIIGETERVASIVRNLLSFARQEKEFTGCCRVADAVDAAVSLFRTIMRRDRIHLDINVPEALPPLACPSQRLQQVLVNLLTNARDAVNAKYESFDERKRIVVSGQSVEDADGRFVRIGVEDTGIGISDEVAGRIFDPFFTTKPKGVGTGLGLSISHGIVKDHGGRIAFSATAGGGTVFHVDVPIADGRST